MPFLPPSAHPLPRHIAIIMDGNGRWARQRLLPRIVGHRQGVASLRRCVQACAARGVQALTVFAFSSENWRRPPDEVSGLMGLMGKSLASEVPALQEAGVRLRFIGQLNARGETITEEALGQSLSLACLPDPDLLIRTGGEQRISNFLLWQCAYSELFFSDRLWPDFDEAALDEALAAYAARERRFGKTSEQVQPPVRPQDGQAC